MIGGYDIQTRYPSTGEPYVEIDFIGAGTSLNVGVNDPNDNDFCTTWARFTLKQTIDHLI
ncbi:MAG: hypothetical protein NT038_09815 [Euryarchaeota archaeon]|nr:hypothetical protein [Euryarchaeota archaeon]